MQCSSVISYSADVPCPGPRPSSDLFSHVCDFCFFLLPRCLFFCPGMWCLTYSFPSLFVRLQDLLFAWLVSAHVSAPYVIAGTMHEL